MLWVNCALYTVIRLDGMYYGNTGGDVDRVATGLEIWKSQHHI